MSGARTFGNINFNDKWTITGLPPHISLRFKSMFMRVSKATAGEFVLVDSPDTCTDLLWFLERYPMAISDADSDRLQLGRDVDIARGDYFQRVMKGDWKPSELPAFKPDMPPYPFQAQGAAICSKLGRLLVLDDVGLGKTITALATIAQSQKMPAAVVVQAHLTEQWAEEYIDAFTTMTSHIIKGTRPYELPHADIYIFKYSNIFGWTDIAAAGVFKSVVFDEIQELRTGTGSRKGHAAKVFANHAELRLGLTATPIYNYGSEIFNVVEMISPGALGSWGEFLIEWCTSKGSSWVVRDPQALGAYLRESTLAIRRTEDDVQGQMPPVNVLMHEIDFDERVVAGVAEEARALALTVMNGTFMERGQAARELDMMARHATGMAKAKGVSTLVRMLVEAGESVLVGGWHRDVYEVWLRELRDLNPAMYTGSESSKQKQRTKEAFISGESPIMLISLRSGSGLDGLQRVCSKVVIGELDWSPQVHKQLIGRLRRPGQQHQVDAIYAHTNGGSDPVLVEMLGLKASQSQGIVDPFSGVVETHSDDSRIKRLAQAYLDDAGVSA